jgi:hypothetical protein
MNNWSYEEEWRLQSDREARVLSNLILPPSASFLFPNSCIKSVYFGTNMEEEEAETRMSSIRDNVQYKPY